MNNNMEQLKVWLEEYILGLKGLELTETNEESKTKLTAKREALEETLQYLNNL